MPLQNRVDPFGMVHANTSRSLFTGNRGVLHDPATKTLLKRRWTTRAWIVCTCAYKGKHREVMGRNTQSGNAGWTELFFLDEVTALAAGHRPCFTCRRAAASEFLARHRTASADPAALLPDLDRTLHAERRASGGPPAPLDRATLRRLPEGAMLSAGGTPYAIRAAQALRWTFDGYDRAAPLADLDADDVTLLTPPVTLAILRAGFAPVWHPSAAALAP